MITIKLVILSLANLTYVRTIGAFLSLRKTVYIPFCDTRLIDKWLRFVVRLLKDNKSN